MGEPAIELAELFETMAKGLDILGEGDHRVRAYYRASESLRALDEPLERVRDDGRLQDIPGVGKIFASKIDEYLRTGALAAHTRLLDRVPVGLFDVLEIPGVGPRRTQRFWEALGVKSVEDLEAAASVGQLQRLKGIGARTERNILEGIRAWRRQRSGRIPLGVAWPLVQEILHSLRALPAVIQAEAAGSLRRHRETLGDLTVLAASHSPEPVIAHFCRLPMVAEVLLSGANLASVRTMDGIQVDLRVLPPARWGSALQYFTGSQAHNIRLRALAHERGLSLSEHGFRRLEEVAGEAAGGDIVCETEVEVYAALGLPWISPALREDRGEIEAALAGRLPHLVRREDILGDFQCHTARSDGQADLLTMAEAARSAGLRYLVVSDHTGHEGLAPADVESLLAEVAQVNARMGDGFRVVAGIEVGIRADGRLDWPDEALAQVDFVIAAVHTDLGQPRDAMTARLLRAMRNPYVDLIAHPTGRLLGRRLGADLDMEAVFQAALETGVALEINAWPQRLDLNATHVRRAVDLGVLLAISSYAHDADGFAVLDFGVAMARRGWVEPDRLLNARPLDEVLAWRARRLGGR